MTLLATLETPCLILDRSRLNQNAARMTRRFANSGVQLRPHMKTAKSIDVARIALAGNFGGVTVSTLKEAEYFADHGIDDITYAVSVVPEKMPRITALIKRGVKLGLITDQVAVAHDLSRRAQAEGVTLDVLIDAGNSYQCRTLADIQHVAETERLAAVNAATQLRAAGLPCPVVSVGSTPTATHGLSLEGLTEMRCGVYMFGDVFQAEIGSHRLEDIAVSVLATVIGHRPDMNSALIDAGGLALSKDRSTGAAGLAEDIGFGMILSEDGSRRIGSVRVGHVYQEHGMLTAEGPFPFDELPIGARVRVLPNHVCMTAAMYDGYRVVDSGAGPVVDLWSRINGW